MSNFWSNALGLNTPAPAPARVEPTDQTQGPWWSRPLVPQTTQEPAQQFVQPPQVPQQPQPPSKAVSARSSATCPNCGSGNYFQPQGQPNAMTQCYECGYNPRFSQASGGIPSDKSTPVQAARQVSTANNFNPQSIVAHVG